MPDCNCRSQLIHDPGCKHHALPCQYCNAYGCDFDCEESIPALKARLRWAEERLRTLHREPRAAPPASPETK